MRELWYEAPAKQWEEALPLGNGRLGAMVYGGLGKEQIQVNEESIWYGGRKRRENPDSVRQLSKIRRLLLEGNIEEAEVLMKWAMSGCPGSMPSYQTLGDILIQFYEPSATGLHTALQTETASGYHRKLDLERASALVSYELQGVKYIREAFLSHPADAMVMRLWASEPRLNFTVRLDRCKNAYEGIRRAGENGLCLYGNLGRGGFEYAMTVKAGHTDGNVQIIGEHLIVREASEVLLVFSADCSFHSAREEREEACRRYAGQLPQPVKELWEEATEEELQEQRYSYAVQRMMQERLGERLELLLSQDFEELRAAHERDYRELFDRLRLRLGGMERYEGLPMERRLALAAEGKEAGLAPLYLDYGRYLLISSSRPGNLPANLQGIWNKELKPSWESKYTININTEMNYWLAESGNLSECHLPLFDLLRRMLTDGRRAARELYGCRGFVAHHNTDIYGDCGVQDFWNPGSYWVMGAAWLCTHLWTHYQYTADRAFLAEAFPIMREAAEFFLDFLIEHQGHLVTCPSVSPENTFLLPNGHSGANTFGVTMDNQILTDLFGQCISAADILGVTDELNDRLREARGRLYPMQTAEDGRLMEWPEDYRELDPGHRHISHLYGLHPSEQITVDGTPELAAAAAKTLERRLANGGGHTGWSRAWIMNHYAKLWKGERAYENFLQLLAKSTYPNLFDKHPPFQIDGNFGAAAALLEMLVQSSGERIVLLPALPRAWESGELKGIRVKGCAELDVSWSGGQLVEATLYAGRDGKFLIKYRDKSCRVSAKQGESCTVSPEDF